MTELHKILKDIAKNRKNQDNRVKNNFRSERLSYQNTGKLMCKFYAEAGVQNLENKLKILIKESKFPKIEMISKINIKILKTLPFFLLILGRPLSSQL